MNIYTSLLHYCIKTYVYVVYNINICNVQGRMKMPGF